MTDEELSVNFEPCPECGRPIPVHKSFPKWCANCNWNLSPPEYAEAAGPIGKYYRALGRKNARRLFEAYANATPDQLRPRLTVSKLAALSITIVVHLLSVLVLVTALSIIIVLWPRVMPIVLGVLLLAFAWLLRPRLRSAPTKYLTSTELPGLFVLVHEIGDCLGVRRVNRIVVNAEVNASIYYSGLRQEPILLLASVVLFLIFVQVRLLRA